MMLPMNDDHKHTVSLGKGEVDSSILSGSTMNSLGNTGVSPAAQPKKSAQTDVNRTATEPSSREKSAHRPFMDWVRNAGPRFWQKVDVRGPDECWPWVSSATAVGYGRIKIAGRLESSHRVAFMLASGRPLPEGDGYHGTVVRHSCDNRACCNPAHLSLGTQRDNVGDMVAKGRHGNPPGHRRRVAS